MIANPLDNLSPSEIRAMRLAFEEDMDRKYYAFPRAKARIRATLASLPLQEAEGRRGVLWHRMTGRAMRERGIKRAADLALPFGWTFEKDWNHDAIQVAPAWYILPRRLWHWAYWHFCEFAIDIGAARTPYEGCYFSELEWWPKGPRMTRMERWEAGKGRALLSERSPSAEGQP